jgi:YggT family protein
MLSLVRLIHTVMTAYSLILIGRIFLEMLLGPYHAVVLFLRRLTEPLLAPIRRHVPLVKSGGMAFDLSPIVALLLLWVIEQVLTRLLLGLAYR